MNLRRARRCIGAIAISGFGATTAAGAATDGVIEEIVVTATKRAQSSELPGSITALGQEDLEIRSIRSTEDLQGAIPNLNYREFLGTPLTTIRGIGGNIDSGAVEPGVAVYLDGMYLPRPDMLALEYPDLERAEVLRGPQGTLYGKTQRAVPSIASRSLRRRACRGNYPLAVAATTCGVFR